MSKHTVSKFIIASVDFILIFLSFIISLGITDILFGNNRYFLPNEQFDERVIIHLILSVFGVGWFWQRLRHYTYRKPLWFELKEILRTLIILAVFELAIIAFAKLYFSRYLWAGTWILALLLVPIGRIFTKKMLFKLGYFLKDTIIIGNGKNALDTYIALSKEAYLGLNIKGFVLTNPKNDITISTGVKIISSENLWENINPNNTQFVIVLEETEHEERLFWLRKLAKHQCRYISVIPTIRGLPLYSTDMSFLFSSEVMILRINNNLAKRSSRFIKRSVDIIGSITIILGLSPLLLTLYFLIKRDGGDVIYGHERIGRDGKIFKCLKFRSMVVNSKEVLAELLANDPIAKAEWEKDFKLKNDPRITKVGHFLRKTSLDELPQLFNVLKGEMSLVGPRPIVQEELERYQDDVSYYLMAKPGMTGLWQVSGRNDVDYETRVYFDSWYVKNWSLWNDIAILFKTINVVLKRDGAY
ncbi:hypothetical protein MHD_10915 [Mannheimia granulomatis]|uniref:UDP-phosphate galactose phosphotransferase n=1 Tax=Mannheimia granulomatis TaxID=85402 RepID=A0A011NA61_9PAST|nr:undecaprenyl-phosphate galactose phosphotransferase WbaP [Mannheimia granulomatis]EXI61325.1 UDP-phosphate galactose phosphotransferase [Mannheimia granulomatis]RGE47292.1 hypothetical protein MHD_10915 [Mannheimia granulomatis]